MSAPGVPRFVFTTELIAHAPDQTDIVYRMARPRSVKDRSILEAMWGPLQEMLVSLAEPLIKLASADALARAADRQAEPEVPAGAASHLAAAG
jgi:hypothetical protein